MNNIFGKRQMSFNYEKYQGMKTKCKKIDSTAKYKDSC